jgi:hypothetical protein
MFLGGRSESQRLVALDATPSRVEVGDGGVKREARGGGLGGSVEGWKLSDSDRHWKAVVYVVNTRDTADKCEHTERERVRERESAQGRRDVRGPQ